MLPVLRSPTAEGGRVEYAGAIYHLMSRGDRREQIYYDDVDRQDFLKTLAEACQKTGFEVHAYCLMKNHFHLAPKAFGAGGEAWGEEAVSSHARSDASTGGASPVCQLSQARMTSESDVLSASSEPLPKAAPAPTEPSRAVSASTSVSASANPLGSSPVRSSTPARQSKYSSLSAR